MLLSMLIILIAFIVIGTMLLATLGCLVAWVSIRPPRLASKRPPPELELHCHTVHFNSSDGTEIKGWYFEREQPCGALILAHGMCSNRSQMLPWASWLWEAGYSLLLFDFRAMGESGGKFCTMGLKECDDVITAGEFLKAKVNDIRVPLGVLGFSMGGVSAIMAASKTDIFDAVISHGAYTDLDSAITQRCIRHFGMLAPTVEVFARLVGNRLYPGDASQVSPIESAEGIQVPVLFLNGRLDRVVLEDNARRLKMNTKRSELCILPNSDHGYPHLMDAGLYRTTVLEFLNAQFQHQQ